MGKSIVRVQGMKIIAILMLVVLTGCASNYKDFKVTDVDENEGVAYFGNLHFSVNEVSSEQLTTGMVLAEGTHSNRVAVLGLWGLLLQAKFNLAVGSRCVGRGRYIFCFKRLSRTSRKWISAG